jgi:hypothetical protein
MISLDATILHGHDKAPRYVISYSLDRISAAVKSKASNTDCQFEGDASA